MSGKNVLGVDFNPDACGGYRPRYSGITATPRTMGFTSISLEKARWVVVITAARTNGPWSPLGLQIAMGVALRADNDEVA